MGYECMQDSVGVIERLKKNPAQQNLNQEKQDWRIWNEEGKELDCTDLGREKLFLTLVVMMVFTL